ncbi:hypothetical protein JCM8097_002717 [Rhodosporidiobolus ruineniae]
MPPPVPPEVFQASLAVERQWLREVIRAVLSSVLFHRVLGNSTPSQLDVAGVTFPTVAHPDVEEFVRLKTELLMKVLSANDPSGTPKRAKLYLSFYPTPLPSLPFPPPSAPPSAPFRPSSPSSAPRAHSSPSPSSAAPSSSLRRPASLVAQAGAVAPAALTGALGWFAARGREALSGAAGHEAPAASAPSSGAAVGGSSSAPGGREVASGMGEELQEAELAALEQVVIEREKPWEGWCVEFEVLEGREAGGRTVQEREERLRAQLNDFLLRSLNFTLLKTAHVPPITSTELSPYGVLILVNPPHPPFAVPKPVVEDVKAFPALRSALTLRTGAAGGRTEQVQVQAGAGRW